MAYNISILGNSQNSERVGKLSISRDAPYRKTVIYRVPISNLTVGELLLIHGDAQVTTPYLYNVMLASDIVLMSSNGNTIVELCEGQGQNFNKEEHHFNWTRVASHEVAIARNGQWYICLRAWSASSAAASSGNSLVVDSDYGRLTVWRFTPV